ncbi:hypothetical protein BV22DRAFT_546770 [Leucogyrophana mollusca]|uniref:Uncharacterized protein n=1 Tax=Leucogyrophana mollusca TaxID=85980 RepID=A0ACB8BDR5_9AGAM|nr:hypothetical protein BV22DRAFT_546770 [Leucogyrophana mollusca]
MEGQRTTGSSQSSDSISWLEAGSFYLFCCFLCWLLYWGVRACRCVGRFLRGQHGGAAAMPFGESNFALPVKGITLLKRVLGALLALLLSLLRWMMNRCQKLLFGSSKRPHQFGDPPHWLGELAIDSTDDGTTESSFFKLRTKALSSKASFPDSGVRRRSTPHSDLRGADSQTDSDVQFPHLAPRLREGDRSRRTNASFVAPWAVSLASRARPGHRKVESGDVPPASESSSGVASPLPAAPPEAQFTWPPPPRRNQGSTSRVPPLVSPSDSDNDLDSRATPHNLVHRSNGNSVTSSIYPSPVSSASPMSDISARPTSYQISGSTDPVSARPDSSSSSRAHQKHLPSTLLSLPSSPSGSRGGSDRSPPASTRTNFGFYVRQLTVKSSHGEIIVDMFEKKIRETDVYMIYYLMSGDAKLLCPPASDAYDTSLGVLFINKVKIGENTDVQVWMWVEKEDSIRCWDLVNSDVCVYHPTNLLDPPRALWVTDKGEPSWVKRKTWQTYKSKLRQAGRVSTL